MFLTSDFKALEKTFRSDRTRKGSVPSYVIGGILSSITRSRVDQRAGEIRTSVAGDCRSPRTVVLFGEHTTRTGWIEKVVKRGAWLPTLYLEVRCRTCKECLRQRARQWTARAIFECDLAARTWMATFTLSPGSNWQLMLRASARLRRGGVDLKTLPKHEQLAELRREFGAELTKFFKRIRKAGCYLRYYLVFEAHKSGLPHAHALIHEVFDAHPVRHSMLVANWTLGHTKFKLCDANSAAYVAKYLTKEARLRVRASLGYGRSLAPLGVANEMKSGEMPFKEPTGTADIQLSQVGSFETLSGRSFAASENIVERNEDNGRRLHEKREMEPAQVCSEEQIQVRYKPYGKSPSVKRYSYEYAHSELLRFAGNNHSLKLWAYHRTRAVLAFNAGRIFAEAEDGNERPPIVEAYGRREPPG